MVNVTIKFNYAIKLYLIAKCVACGAGFCDGDWLNEINELLSIFECVGCYFLSPWTCEGVVQCHYIITREEQTCTETTAQHSKYLHFHLFTCPRRCQSFNFGLSCVVNVVDASRTRLRAFVFDLKWPRFAFGFPFWVDGKFVVLFSV